MSKLITAKLEDLCTQVTDGTHSSPKLLTEGFPLIKGKDINQGFINFETCDYISKEDHLKVIARSKPEIGDILFSNIGSVGDMAFVKTNKEFSIKNVALIKPDTSKIDNLYLYYFMLSRQFQSEIKSIAQGAAQPFISLNLLRNLELNIFENIKTQKKISCLLSNYDNLIENNNKKIKILEEIAQKLYKYWFIDFKFPGCETAVFNDSELGKIPYDWEIGSLKDVLNLIKDITTSGEHLACLKYVPIDCIPRKKFLLSVIDDYKNAKSSLILFKKSDILFGNMRSYFHKVILAPFDGVTRTTCFVFRPKDEYSLSWLYLTLFQEATVSYSALHSKGATIPYAFWEGGLANMKIKIPPKNIIKKFNEIILPTLTFIQQSFYKLQTLKQTRDLLLSHLMSGEIDVETMEIV